MQTSTIGQDALVFSVGDYVAAWVKKDGGVIAERLYGNRYQYEVVFVPVGTEIACGELVHCRDVLEKLYQREMQRLRSMTHGDFHRSELIHALMCEIELRR